MTEQFDVSVDGETYRYRLVLDEKNDVDDARMLVVYCNDSVEATVDIRYEQDIVDAASFRAWAETYMHGYCRSECTICRVAA